jgi:hypothetical protein
MVLALVVSTVPAMAFSGMFHPLLANSAQTPDSDNCHEHAKAPMEDSKSQGRAAVPCCDKNMSCMGSFSPAASALELSRIIYPPTATSRLLFSHAQNIIDFGFSNQIKRPPKA